MPIYEYRCDACGEVSTHLQSSTDAPGEIACEHCDGTATRILSRPSVHLSKSSKLSRLDPKYDRMVDQAIRSTPEADPDRHLKRMKPLPDKK